MKRKILLIFMVAANLQFAQSKDPDIILNNVIENFQKVNDYQVNIKIRIDVDFLKAPESNAKLYFKQPDKINIKSESFALLPKEGLNFSPISLIEKEHTAIYEKEEVIDGHKTSVIKIIPLGESGDVILSTLWIDQLKNIIRKIETTTKLNGTYSIELKYDDEMSYPLPDKMIFTFDVDKINIPRGLSGDVSSEPKKQNESKSTTGKVFIDYSNYEVNKGISDNFFEKKKQE